MIQLTTNLSDPLLELLREGEVPVDGVEVGPWFSVRQVRGYRQALPGLPFTFHASNLIDRVGLVPGALSQIGAYQRNAVRAAPGSRCTSPCGCPAWCG
jgi:hypothetical protein